MTDSNTPKSNLPKFVACVITLGSIALLIGFIFKDYFN